MHVYHEPVYKSKISQTAIKKCDFKKINQELYSEIFYEFLCELYIEAAFCTQMQNYEKIMYKSFVKN